MKKNVILVAVAALTLVCINTSFAQKDMTASKNVMVGGEAMMPKKTLLTMRSILKTTRRS